MPNHRLSGPGATDPVHIHHSGDPAQPVPLSIVISFDPAAMALLNRLAATITAAIDRNTAVGATLEHDMSQLDDDIAELVNKVAAEGDVVNAAVTALGAIPTLIQSAVDAALAAGATTAQLQAFTDLGTAIDAQKTTLAAAIPAQPPAP